MPAKFQILKFRQWPTPACEHHVSACRKVAGSLIPPILISPPCMEIIVELASNLNFMREKSALVTIRYPECG
jgi:hypothetical protein